MTLKQGISIPDLALECTQRDTVIDIGCSNGQFLIPMFDLGFKQLIGIDNSYDYNLFRTLTKHIEKSKDLKPEEAIEYMYKFRPLIEFRNDYKAFPYEKYFYSFVICRNFLHLIKDEAKFELIERLYSKLENGGIMYLELNHTENPNIVNDTSIRKIAHNVYESGNFRKKTFYLYSGKDFISEMKDKYKEVIYSEINELTVKVVIKK